MTATNSAQWDYIIVGAGSAGCVLANRLSADSGVSVLLLEAGGSDASPFVQVPAGIVKLIGNPRFDWGHLAEPDSSRSGKVDLWPAGKTLGGSSAINGMLFVRGARADFDHWASLGNPGWSYTEVLPYFKRLESTLFGQDDIRGRDGPQRVEGLRSTHPLAEVFLAAAQQCGLTLNEDYNGADNEGAARPQLTQQTGRRMSAARAFLHPIRHRRNLRVITHARVRHLQFDAQRCRGVVAVVRGEAQSFAARREVLLTSGTLGSPKILLQSGVGPGADLQALGLKVVRDSPDVGSHLREHANSLVCADVNVRTYNVEINGPRIAWNALRWLLTRRGPATSPYPHAVAFFRSRPEEPRPDLQMLFGPFAFGISEQGIVPYTNPAISLVVNACHPQANGQLRLRSSDPDAPPLIAHRLLEHPEDLRRQIAGCRFARRLLQAAPFKPYLAREYLPGPETQTDEQWLTAIRRSTFLGYHPIGTCRMGNDPRAVVAPDLKVQGIDGLRVVDASIMPWHISANTNAATLMIAEKAADLIRGAR